MSGLSIALTKVSSTHHRVVLVTLREAREVIKLETKSFLFHDLMHFAVESEAKLADSFFGALAKGTTYEALSQRIMEIPTASVTKEIAMTERMVGVMTGVLQSDASPQAAISGLRSLLSARGERFPTWFSEDFVVCVKERMRELWGEWNGTPLRETMTLEFSITS